MTYGILPLWLHLRVAEVVPLREKQRVVAEPTLSPGDLQDDAACRSLDRSPASARYGFLISRVLSFLYSGLYAAI